MFIVSYCGRLPLFLWFVDLIALDWMVPGVGFTFAMVGWRVPIWLVCVLRVDLDWDVGWVYVCGLLRRLDCDFGCHRLVLLS